MPHPTPEDPIVHPQAGPARQDNQGQEEPVGEWLDVWCALERWRRDPDDEAKTLEVASSIRAYALAATPPARPPLVPDEILVHAARLATPLHESRVDPGMRATMEADQRGARLVHSFLRSIAGPAPAVIQLLRALDEVVGCFEAAAAEGLQEALAETTDERLKDLVLRRLMHARATAQAVTFGPATESRTQEPG